MNLKHVWVCFSLMMIFCDSEKSFAQNSSGMKGRSVVDIVKSLQIKDDPVCPSFDPSKPKITFLFEGARCYCPKNAWVYLQRSHLLYESPEEIAHYKDQLDPLLIEESSHQFCSVLRTIIKVLPKVSSQVVREQNFIYYPKRGANSAALCAQKLLSEAKGQAVQPSFRAIGYSMGGGAVQEFANELSIKKVYLKSVLTIDPVGRYLRCLTGVPFAINNAFFKKRRNVGSWNNYFQKNDTRSVFNFGFIHIGANGSMVLGADTNVQVTDPNFADHQRIFNSPIVEAGLIRNLSE